MLQYATINLTILDGNSGKRSVKVTRLLIGEGRLLHIDLGAVNLCFGVRRHGTIL